MKPKIAWPLAVTILLIGVGTAISAFLFGYTFEEWFKRAWFQALGACCLAFILWVAPDEHPDDHEARYPDFGDTHQYLDDTESAIVAQKRASDDFYKGVSRGATAVPRVAAGEVPRVTGRVG